MSVPASAANAKLVVHVESDPKAVADVVACVQALPGHTPLTFANFEELEKWFAMPPDQRPAEQPIAAVKLLIWPAEGLPARDDLAKWIARAVAAGVPAHAPVLVTTSEAPATSMAKWISTGVFNLLIKPYDPLILRGHLARALGEKPSGGENLFELKTDAIVEALKAVPMSALSEVGFVTRSDIELPLGRVAKFYGEVFAWNEVRSVYARTLSQTPDPANKGWKVRLTFFGTGRDQTLRIRTRFSPTKEIKEDWRPAAPPANARVSFLIVGDPSAQGSELGPALSRNFQNLDVLSVSVPPTDKATLPARIDGVFVHRDFLDKIEADKRFAEAKRIVISERAIREDDMRALALRAVDVIPLPTERVSLLKRLELLFPELNPSEARPIKTYEHAEALNAGLVVHITEMSEAAMTERYERAFPAGTIRRFVLWFPAEKDTPVLTGRCYKSEPDPAKPGAFLNHFVFFGMSDREAKHIRVWIRDNYIQSKQKN